MELREKTKYFMGIPGGTEIVQRHEKKQPKDSDHLPADTASLKILINCPHSHSFLSHLFKISVDRPKNHTFLSHLLQILIKCPKSHTFPSHLLKILINCLKSRTFLSCLLTAFLLKDILKLFEQPHFPFSLPQNILSQAKQSYKTVRKKNISKCKSWFIMQ